MSRRCANADMQGISECESCDLGMVQMRSFSRAETLHRRQHSNSSSIAMVPCLHLTEGCSWNNECIGLFVCFLKIQHKIILKNNSSSKTPITLSLSISGLFSWSLHLLWKNFKLLSHHRGIADALKKIVRSWLQAQRSARGAATLLVPNSGGRFRYWKCWI